ncbi:MAG: hypothetical protein R3C03_18185 [Pirellulaceae bacterium]
MASSRAHCPQCNKAYKVSPDMIGKATRCKKCDTKFTIKVDDIRLPDDVVKPKKSQASDHTKSASTSSTVVSQMSTPQPSQANRSSATVAASISTPKRYDDQAHADAQLSPYERLANQMSERNDRDSYQERDRYTQEYNRLHGSDSIDVGASRWVFRGIAMMAFGLMLGGLAILGLRLTSIQLLSPVGVGIGVGIGGLGSIMSAVGLRKRIGAALLVGGLPAIGFLGLAGLTGYLFFNGYWSSHSRNTSSNFPTQRNFDWNRPPFDPTPNRTTTQEAAKPANDFANNQPQRNPTFRPTVMTPPKREETKPANNFANSDPKPNPTFRPLGDTPLPLDPLPKQKKTARPPDRTAPSGFNPFGTARNSGFGSNDEEPETDTDSDTDNANSIAIPPRFSVAMAMELQARSTRQFFQSHQVIPKSYIAEHRLSEWIGKDASMPSYYVLPDNLTVLGIDLTSAAGRQQNIGPLWPIFEGDNRGLEMAKEGYALGGLRLSFQGDEVIGVQCVFMKLDGKNLVPGDSYDGKWIGKRGHFDAEVLSDGSRIVGFAVNRISNLEGIRLIWDE